MHGGAAGEQQRAEKKGQGERTSQRDHLSVVVRVVYESNVERMVLTIIVRHATPKGIIRMHFVRRSVATSLALLACLSCARDRGKASKATVQLAPLKVIDIAYMDTTVKACTDFNLYANGGWLKRDTIPASYSSTGVFRDMADRNELVVRSVLDDVMAKRATFPAGNTQRKLGTFYATCMDSAAAEREGIDPIKPELDEAARITMRAQLLDQITALQLTGHNVLFRYKPDVDPHDAAHYMAWLGQAGLGLPDRDYYTRKGPDPTPCVPCTRAH